MTKQLEAEQPHDIAEFSKSDLKSTTSRELENFKHSIEKFFLDEVGKINKSKMYNFDEKLADTYFKINDILRKRNGAKDLVDEIHTRIDNMGDRTNGMQTAIDKLKEHGHDGEIGTFKVTYPGRRD